jgi:hypothetical protein
LDNLDLASLKVKKNYFYSGNKYFIGGNLSQFVKTENLNGPVTDSTKMVFVSTKITKPLVKSGVKFNTVINLGYYNYMHFTMSTIVDNARNLVYYSTKAPTIQKRWQPHELS